MTTIEVGKSYSKLSEYHGKPHVGTVKVLAINEVTGIVVVHNGNNEIHTSLSVLADWREVK